jgi:clan AA aspartic protease
MGLVYTNITLSNPVVDSSVKPIEVKCLVDTGATYLCIPKHISLQLGLKEIQQREIQVADGTSQIVPYVGPIKVIFEDRICFVGAMVLGDECLLGAIPMEDMDLVVHPKLRKVTVNPENPNIAKGLAK